MTITLPGGGGGSGGGGGGSSSARGAHVATSSIFPTSTTYSFGVNIPITWTVQSTAPTGFTTSGVNIRCPHLPPSNALGLWFVFVVGTAEVAAGFWPWAQGESRDPDIIVQTNPQLLVSIGMNTSSGNLNVKVVGGGTVLPSSMACRVYIAQ